MASHVWKKRLDGDGYECVPHENQVCVVFSRASKEYTCQVWTCINCADTFCVWCDTGIGLLVRNAECPGGFFLTYGVA